MWSMLTLNLFVFHRPGMPPWGCRNVFSGCPVPPDTKETKLASDDQEHPPSASKNTGFSFSAAHESVSLQLFPVVWIFPMSLGVICYSKWVLSEDRKNYFKDPRLINSQFNFLIFTSLLIKKKRLHFQKYVN